MFVTLFFDCYTDCMGREQKPYGTEYGKVEYKHDILLPWLQDSGFMHCYRQISTHSLVDIMRCYSLWQAVEQLTHLPGVVLEVGLWRGGTAALLTQRLRGRKEIYLADTFQGVVKAGEHDNRYRGGEHADTSRDIVEALLHGLGLSSWTILEGIFPEETGGALDQEQICFCHIDVDVYQSARDISSWVWERMPIGGVIIYDDYGFPSCQGVRKLVDELSSDTDKLFIYNLNGQAMLVKTS